MTEHEKRLVICALQDYILKCQFMTEKNTFYAPMWTNYQGTANKLIKELKS